MFERLPRLQTGAGYHPKWKEINLAANVPGWQRFRPVQERRVALAVANLDPSADGGTALKRAIAQIIPGDPGEQNRVLQKFMPRAAADPKSKAPRSR
jgi:hypothetical protein